MFILWFEEKKLMFILTCILVEYNMNRTLAESSKKCCTIGRCSDMYTFRQWAIRKKIVMELSTL